MNRADIIKRILDASQPNPQGYYGKGSIDLLDDGKSAVLSSHLIYKDAVGLIHVAFSGLVFDGTSIPRILWSILGMTPFTGRQRKPAIIHDAECQSLRKFHDAAKRKRLRLEADKTLREGCAFRGLKRWKVSLVYRGVRIGAWKEELARSLAGR